MCLFHECVSLTFNYIISFVRAGLSHIALMFIKFLRTFLLTLAYGARQVAVAGPGAPLECEVATGGGG